MLGRLGWRGRTSRDESHSLTSLWLNHSRRPSPRRTQKTGCHRGGWPCSWVRGPWCSQTRGSFCGRRGERMSRAQDSVFRSGPSGQFPLHPRGLQAQGAPLLFFTKHMYRMRVWGALPNAKFNPLTALGGRRSCHPHFTRKWTLPHLSL